LCPARLTAIQTSRNALRFGTIGTLMRPDVLRGVPRTPLVEPERVLRTSSVLHRVGGGVTPAVLPHHRTYGSVYGGS